MTTSTCDADPMVPDFERCYRAVLSRDARFDGWFFVCVKSTRIYCRPSCPARTPLRVNLQFLPTAAAAHRAGFRACKRCRPDASPGSPEWDPRGDAVARAMRLIADGVVDREGVAGIATRLGYSERQVHRLLLAEVGAGPLALARAQRAQTARVLVETTDLRLADVAFAAGFASVRQFNDTVREVFATTPTELRRRAHRAEPSPAGVVTLRLAVRQPFAGDELVEFLGTRAIPGVEEVVDGTYRRTLSLPNGAGVLALTPTQDGVHATLRLDALSDLTTAVHRARRLFDLDADPETVSDLLATDRALARTVRATPGRRVPGHVDGAELAVRAVLGQQVTVTGARTLASRLVERLGKPLDAPDGGLTHRFPDPGAIAGADLSDFGVPGARSAALQTICGAIADGSVTIDSGADREELRAALVALPGIGPWTAEYVLMRAVGDPDAFLPTDLGVRKGAAALGLESDARTLTARAERWRPWRAYAVMHLWAAYAAATPASTPPVSQEEGVTMTTRYTIHPSPVGPLLLAVTPEGAISRVAFIDDDPEMLDEPEIPSDWVCDDGALRGVITELDEYFAGERREFTTPLAPEGTPFQLEVWEALRTIPYGTTASYGEIAAQVGKPTASRAVGAANGKNPIAVIVPCHRVIGANGSLTGYGGGLERKELLLGLEGSMFAGLR